MDKRYDKKDRIFAGNGEVRKNGELFAQVHYDVTLRQEGIIGSKNGQNLPGHYYAVGTVTVSNDEDLFGEDGLSLHLGDGRTFAFAVSSANLPSPTYKIQSIGDLQDLLRK